MVTVKNNVISVNLGHYFRENYGTLECVSQVQQGHSFSDYRPNKKFTETLRHPEISNKLNDVSSVFNKPKHVKNEFLNEEILKTKEIHIEINEKTFVEIKSWNVNTANVFFVDENFKCMWGTLHCQCLSLSKSQISKIKKSPNNKTSLFLNQKNDDSVNFVFRTQKFQNIQDTPVGVFFIKSIISKNIKTLIMHSDNENLIEDLLILLKYVLLDNPLQLFYCCISKSAQMN